MVDPMTRAILPPRGAEWLETDGLGGFATGTVEGERTRRYHALLVSARTPPTGRVAWVKGADATVVAAGHATKLGSQRYAPGILDGGQADIVGFHVDPWPTWTFALPGGMRLTQELFMPRGRPVVVLRWCLTGAEGGLLRWRPTLSGLGYHALLREGPQLPFRSEVRPGVVTWVGQGALVRCLHTGRWRDAPFWYRRFLYEEERARGFDHEEDLASPGELELPLGPEPAWVVLVGPGDDGSNPFDPSTATTPRAVAEVLMESEARRRSGFPDSWSRAADAYLVERGSGCTLVAGYPWFTDWGRDTFIAMRGLCLATGRLDAARDILLAWSREVSGGMLPNRFADAGEREFNAVDASLWFVVAVGEYLRLRARSAGDIPERRDLQEAVDAILKGYLGGTRYGIGVDVDGLVRAGEAGVQLTWMDAKIDDRVITPRTGKPVEIQALWLNALDVASEWNPAWGAWIHRGRASWIERFWDEDRGHLLDVVDADHVPGRVDATCRPNQILAVGGLPVALLDGGRARRVVDTVETRLWTPNGLRTLAPDDPRYRGRYEGGPIARDEVYHQGTAWPWLLGPFVEAWVRVRGGGADVRRAATTRFLDPLLRAGHGYGLGHLPEIADGDPPHQPRGCPFQAWSLGEALRLKLVVLS
jgi:predicted glycogen debranching enzyme